ncbi:WD repeat-containing protein, partial [Drosera capensis]
MRKYLSFSGNLRRRRRSKRNRNLNRRRRRIGKCEDIGEEEACARVVEVCDRNMWREIRSREAGQLRPRSFCSRLRSSGVSSISLSNFKEIVSPHRGAVNSLQVDLTEGRFLFSGASDGSAAVFDIQCASEFEGGGFIARHRSMFVVDKRHQQGHKYAVSSAVWYPVDTGLFVTGSYDNFIKVVMHFKIPGKVYRMAMSTLATSHMLIATGTEDVQARLCDIAAGAFAHTLSGHRDGIMAVEWSKSSEWVLITGGCDVAFSPALRHPPPRLITMELYTGGNDRQILVWSPSKMVSHE